MPRLVCALVALPFLLSGADITIPFEFYGNVIWFPARVNGSAPMHFLFDSAAGATCLNRSVLARLNLTPVQESDRMNAGSGDKPTRIALVDGVRVEFGGVTLDLPRAPVIALDEVAESYGAAVDGIVGYELMERYVVRIDYDARTLTLIDPKKYRPPLKAAALPLEIRNRVPVVHAKINVPGRLAIDGEFLVDAPFPGSIHFTKPFADRHGLLAAARAFTGRTLQGRAMGVGGEIRRETARIESIQLGPYKVDRPTAEFSDSKGGAFARTDIAGILGASLFTKFRVTLDHAHTRLILEPGPSLNDPIEADTSGLSFSAIGPSYKTFAVPIVAENSPAAEAGIQPGDRIVGFDGTLWQFRTLLRKPDQQHTLTIERDGRRRSVTIKTRRMI